MTTTTIKMPFTNRLRAAYSVLRGVSTHPELAHRIHILSQQADEAGQSRVNTDDYGEVYGVYIWAHKAVSKTAEQIASKRVRVVTDEGEEIQGHPVTELLAYVNDTMSSVNLWQSYVINMLLYGESPFEIVDNGRGDPVEIWDRLPEIVTVVPDKSRLQYPSVAGYRIGDNDELISPENMWFDKFYDPKNRWRGLAPIQAVREGITIDLFAQAWSKQLLKSGARPDFAIIAPQGVTKSEKEKYEEHIMRSHSGPDNWHKPIVLEEGITDIKPLNFPPKDMQWLEQREFSRDEVGAVFGMPDEIMGYGRDTYENFNTAWRVWWLLTLKPMIDHRDNSLQTFFTKHRSLLRPGEFVRTDLSDIGALQDDITQKVDNAVKLVGLGYSANEVNDRLGLGMPEIDEPEPGPAFLLAPTAESEPEQEPQKSADWNKWQQVAINSFKRGKSAAVPFQHINIDDDDRYTLAAVLGMCKSVAQIKAVFSHRQDYTTATVKQVLGQRDDIPQEQLDLEDEFIDEVQPFLVDQSERVADFVARTGEQPDKDFWDAELLPLIALLTPFVTKWVESSISANAVLLGGVGLGLDATVNAKAAEWAGKYAVDLAKGLNKTTRELAKAKIKNWLQSGQPLNVLADDLAKVIGPQWRASLIAQTEVTRAIGEGTLQVAREVGAKMVMWQTALDERVCPVCSPLHGLKRKPGGTFPGGFTSPPAHPRCRCGLLLDV